VNPGKRNRGTICITVTTFLLSWNYVTIKDFKDSVGSTKMHTYIGVIRTQRRKTKSLRKGEGTRDISK
jgi:hypothetical protein